MENSVAFITCVNDEETYKESLLYIDRLIIPKGFTIEKIAIRDAKSITSGYNEAMKKCKSKYKVYLHQDTFIINQNFINDMLKIFSDKNVGMFGAVGSIDVPENAVWWESQRIYGSICDNVGLIMSEKNHNYMDYDINEEYKKVEAIDGLIMVTQYDVKWREDIFDGWHFYDVSQSAEFVRNGYDVVVPKQESSWYIHDCGYIELGDDYQKYRLRFIEEYKK